MAWDAVVVGSGPNGLAAAICMARSGASVLVLEAHDEPGGGARSAELVGDGFVSDVCSAAHPLAAASPFFRTLSLTELGIEFVHPPAPLAHLLDDMAVFLERDLHQTAAGLGPDGSTYRKLFGPLVERSAGLTELLFGPLRVPVSPLAGMRFLPRGLGSARGLAARFGSRAARALFAGLAAHSMMPLDRFPSAAFGTFLGTLGHVVGWPIVRGGSGRIAEGLVTQLESLGGSIETGREVGALTDVPPAGVILFDVSPRSVARIAGSRLPARFRRRLEGWPPGPGVFKLDWALSAPIPWTDPRVARAGTVHLGGDLDEVAAAETLVAAGGHPERPFVILVQPSLFDEGRCPPGHHTVWAYCHVPNGSSVDMTDAIESQIERFAPGFRDVVLARHRLAPGDLERYNPNYPGGDINGGAQGLARILLGATRRWDPYSTPDPGLFLCSSSTPPGAGVHGMCGLHAARSALRSLDRRGQGTGRRGRTMD